MVAVLRAQAERARKIVRYRMVESLDPEMVRHFLFVTGDVLNERTKQLFALTGARYLRKPFRLDDLLRAIEGVLK